MSETPVPASAAGADEEDKAKRLTPAQWERMRTLYELGEHSMTDLAKEFGISASAISQRFKRDKVERGSRAHELKAKVAAKAVEKAVEETATFAAQRRKRIEDTKTQAYKSLELFHQLIHREVVEAVKAGDPIASRSGNIKTLRQAILGVEASRIGRYALLDVEGDIDTAALPDIVVRDITEDEIYELQNRDEDLGGELEEIPVAEDDEVVEET
jgi:predicted DNA-binding protein YlxM (UPF0122 family)